MTGVPVAEAGGDIRLPPAGATVIIRDARVAAGSFVLTALLIVAIHLLTN